MTSEKLSYDVETKVFSCKINSYGSGLRDMIDNINVYLQDKNGVNIQYHNIGSEYVIATIIALIPPGK